MFRNSIVPITAGVMLALAGSAQAAGTKTTTFAVNATVASNCLIARPPRWPSAATTAAPQIDSERRRLPFAARKNAPYTIALECGGARQLRWPAPAGRGTETLQYNLYTTRGAEHDLGQQRWQHRPGRRHGGGSASPTRSRTPCTGGLPNNVTNQAAAVGAYTDTITVTSPTDRPTSCASSKSW